MIELNDICKGYGNKDTYVRVLDSINLNVESGKFVVVMGQSGSGKSTLLNIMGCLDDPDTGTYMIEGVDIGSLSNKQKSKIRSEKMGFIFQAFHLIPELTVYENVSLPLIYRGIGKQKRKIMVDSILEHVGLEYKKKNYPSQLSGGEQQRVAISRALVGDPVVLFADEPTGNLDTQNAKEILLLLQKLNIERKTTIIMVTHNPAHINFGNQLIKIEDGKVCTE